jgi:hypothetical protein
MKTMYVNRRTYIVKKGMMDQVLARLRARERADWPGRLRIYASEVGVFDTIALEAEFDSPQEFESFFSGLPDLPDLRAAQATLAGLTEPGGSNEVWQLLD